MMLCVYRDEKYVPVIVRYPMTTLVEDCSETRKIHIKPPVYKSI